MTRWNPIDDLETSMDRLIGKCDFINTNMRGLVDTRRGRLDSQRHRHGY